MNTRCRCDIHGLGPVLHAGKHDTMNTTIQQSTTVPTSIRLDPGTEKRLDYLATHTGRSKAYYLRELVEQGLGDLEDYYLAAEELERVRKGESKVHSAAEVRTDLGLDD